MPLWLARKLSKIAEERHPGSQPVYTRSYSYDNVDAFSDDMPKGTPGQRVQVRRTGGRCQAQSVPPPVCRTCNGGWMARLEDGVKPIMVGFLCGTPKTIDPLDELVLATWVAKTCLTYDASFSNRYISNEIGTHRLYSIGMPMVCSHFSIGHDPDYTSEGSRVESRSGRMRITWPDGDSFIAVQFHFQFEHLIIRAAINCLAILRTTTGVETSTR